MWIFCQQRRIGGLGGVGAQAGQHRVDVVAVGQFGELGADGQVDGVVAALVLEQLGARRDQPHRRGGGAPGRTEADLALALQPGVHVHGVVGRGRLGEPKVAQFAGHLGGLAALAAGVEHPDPGVGELGRGDVGHVGAASPARRAAAPGRTDRRRVAARCTPWPRGRPAVGSAPSPRPSASPPRGRRTAGFPAGNYADERADPACRTRYPL